VKQRARQPTDAIRLVIDDHASLIEARECIRWLTDGSGISHASYAVVLKDVERG
jgi:hypothetical protein